MCNIVKTLREIKLKGLNNGENIARVRLKSGNFYDLLIMHDALFLFKHNVVVGYVDMVKLSKAEIEIYYKEIVMAHKNEIILGGPEKVGFILWLSPDAECETIEKINEINSKTPCEISVTWARDRRGRK
jgi:hypothetical protein